MKFLKFIWDEMKTDPAIMFKVTLMTFGMVVCLILAFFKTNHTIQLSDISFSECYENDGLYEKIIRVKGIDTVTLVYSDSICNKSMGYIDLDGVYHSTKTESEIE